jgi:DNA-binding beta-propeller fold protein YncE
MTRSLAALLSCCVLLLTACPDENEPPPPPPTNGCETGDLWTRECGTCGTQTATCTDGEFGPFGQCEEPASCETTCTEGSSLSEPCGNCGSRTRTCAAGAWSEWSECSDEGECAPAASESEACGSDEGACSVGSRARTCSATCEWQEWGECAGHVEPAPEVCGDTTDNDCNGSADEGCACQPALMGQGGSFALPAGTIQELVADPNRCFVYALDVSTTPRLHIIDTSSKKLLSSVALDEEPTDVDLSADGSYLVVSHRDHKLSNIEIGVWTVTQETTVSDPYAIEVADGGRVFYAELDQWVDVRSIQLGGGVATDLQLGDWALYQGDIELSADGKSLYGGESGISGGSLIRWDVTGPGLQQVDESTWDDNYGFPYPQRHVYLSPGGQHVYYAGAQLDAANLANVRGQVGERVLAADAAGTFFVSESGVWDADLVRQVKSFAAPVTAAALASADRELWSFSQATGKVSYQNIDDYVFGADLGERETEAGPLADYTIDQLIADPVRSRLYGLDRGQGVLVVIDSTSLQATREIFLGPNPTRMAVNPEGTRLFVGSLGNLSLQVIDLTAAEYLKSMTLPRLAYDVAVLSDNRVAVIDDDQWTTLTVVDADTGAMIVDFFWVAYAGALGVTADGKKLYVGESGSSGSTLFKFDASSESPTQMDQTDYDDGYGFPYPGRALTVVPDDSGVFYASYMIEGNDLSLLRYDLQDPIYSVTPDSRLLVGASQVYAVADGAPLGAIAAGPVQAVSADGKKLFVAQDGAVAAIDLTTF